MSTIAKTEANTIDEVMQQSYTAFLKYKKFSLTQRADFMRAIAVELENIRQQVIPVTMKETNLPEGRMNNELSRTIFQLNDYAANAEAGRWLDVRINKGKPQENVDLRKTLVPLGPVVVFGSSNFPYAYSTAGGDTACAFAAGCPVVVKAHPAHEQTSEIVADAIMAAVRKCNMPQGVFLHVKGTSFETGTALVKHPLTKAVGFTGSLSGGKALFDVAAQREEPIPVFAEMGSVNPVYLLPDKLQNDTAEVAKMYAASITQGVGQFCTNPGLIFGIEGESLQQFIKILAAEIKKCAPGDMLHEGIAKNYGEKRQTVLEQKGVEVESVSETAAENNQGIATLASTTGETFLNNATLHKEVFGPYSLVVKCKDKAMLLETVRKMEGQLTCTLIGTDKDLGGFPELLDAVQGICGRLVFNGVPTGVAVCTAMQHGGPFPATTDGRFTSVGSDGIRRFARPLCYQNFSDELLPDELKDNNPLGIWRTINDVLTKEGVTAAS